MVRAVTIALLTFGSLAFGNPFNEINTSEWRLAQELPQDTDARRTSCPSNWADSACFYWPLFMFQAKDVIHDWLTTEAPSQQFNEAISEWHQESETEIIRQYKHYSHDLLVYFNGELLAFILVD